MQEPTPPESSPDVPDTQSDVALAHVVHVSLLPTDPLAPLLVSKTMESAGQQKNGNGAGDTRRMVGRKRRHSPTVHGWRFHWLITQLEKKGVTQSELARRTGLGVTYINAYRNIESTGVSGISAETVQTMRDRMGLDPRYFFDPYEGERPHEMYLLDAKREAVQLAQYRQELSEIARRLAESERRNADMERRLDERLAAVEGAKTKRPDRQPRKAPR